MNRQSINVAMTQHRGLRALAADWAKPDGRTLGIWYAFVPAPDGDPTGLTVPFTGGPGDSISAVADIFLALGAALPETATSSSSTSAERAGPAAWVARQSTPHRGFPTAGSSLTWSRVARRRSGRA